MEKKKFKYSTEFSVNMYLNSYMFLQQTELDYWASVQTTFNEANPCNIYFITRRSRVSLDPKFLKVEKRIVTLKYHVHNKEKKLVRYLEIPFQEELKNVKLECEYPYSNFRLTDGDLLNMNCKLSVMIDEMHKRFPKKEPLLDHEVLYIGQAYGKDGKRTALDRLPSHSTLQNIYSEAMNRNPDSEIWIMLAAFTELRHGIMSGTVQIPKENKEEDIKRFANFMDPEKVHFTEKQRIDFTEAALIRTFLPSYNKEYKDTFPNPAHTSYSSCYELGLNGIVVETDTSQAGRWLYSTALKREHPGGIGMPYWQFGEFHFVTEEDRFKMFNHEYL